MRYANEMRITTLSSGFYSTFITVTQSFLLKK